MMDIVGNRTVYSVLKEQVKKSPVKVFLYYENQEYTFEEMFRRVNQTANFLKRAGVKKGEKVSVLLDNCPEFYFIWFGCAAVGAVMVPINTASTCRELNYFFTHSDSVLVITDSKYDKQVAEVCNNVKSIKQVILLGGKDQEYNTNRNFHYLISSESAKEISQEVFPNDVCAMMYTSGTTAKPKGVQITHHNYVFAGESSARTQMLTANDRYLIFLPLFHANSQYYTTMACLVTGASIVLLNGFSATTFWKSVQKFQPTVSSFVTTVVKILLKQVETAEEKNHTIRQAFYGLYLSRSDLEQFESRFGVRLYQWFGMTESITANIATPLFEERRYDEEGQGQNPALGRPALSQEVKIVDENHKEVQDGTIGEIAIKSPSFMAGYYKNPEATIETLKNGWLYTGDNGYKNEEGYIWFVDRNKDMIKRSGENISSLEVESVINSHPAVHESAVVAVPDEIRDESVKAFIQLHEGETLSAEEIASFCKEQLSDFKVPEYFEFVTKFPRTSIGKIQKNVLRKNSKRI